APRPAERSVVTALAGDRQCETMAVTWLTSARYRRTSAPSRVTCRYPSEIWRKHEWQIQGDADHACPMHARVPTVSRAFCASQNLRGARVSWTAALSDPDYAAACRM